MYSFFLLASAYFACCETAFTAVSRTRLRTIMEGRNGGKAKLAKQALWVCDRFDKTLTTILVGNNIFHACCATLSTLLVLQQFNQSQLLDRLQLAHKIKVLDLKELVNNKVSVVLDITLQH